VLLISDLEFGGAQRQVIELANHMDPQVFRVHVCSLADYVPLAERLTDRPSRLHIVPKRHKFDFSVVPKLAALFRKLHANVVHTFLFDADFFGRLGAAMARTPVVIGSERNCYGEPKKRNLLAWRLTQRLVSLTIANSNAGAEYNSRLLHQPLSKYRVVHNGVDVQRFCPRESSSLKAELGLRPDELVVGMFGSFKPQKNHVVFLRAARLILDQLPNVRFVLVGDELYLQMSDSARTKQLIESTVTELGLRDRCLFLGNRQDVERYYSLCDLTVLPSLFEGTPNVALESMACGVPVIASNVSDNAYVIPDGRAGFVVPVNDEAAISKKVLLALNDSQLRKTLSSGARNWVLQEFSCARLAEKNASIYHEALALQSRTGK
jgi:glycosyltransferase involved in cell wall biosynthesis